MNSMSAVWSGTGCAMSRTRRPAGGSPASTRKPTGSFVTCPSCASSPRASGTGSRQGSRHRRCRSGRTGVLPWGQVRRARYLFSGMLTCGVCGGGMSVISATHVGCSAARNKGTCTNRKTIARREIEGRVLGALGHRLMDPDLFAVFCEAFTEEMNRLRREAGDERETLHARTLEDRAGS